MEIKVHRMDPFGVMVTPTKKGHHIADLDVSKLRDLARQENLLLLRGFENFESSDELAEYSENWGPVSVWPFGKVLELREQKNPEDHIFDNNYVPLHWDGMYRPQVPEFQIFQCVEAPGKSQGGRTTFSHTSLALAHAPEALRRSWELVTGSYERKMEFYHSKSVAPIVETHPIRGFKVLRYNEPPSTGFGPFLNPPILEFTGAEGGFHETLRESLYHPRNFYAHEWQQGDLVVSDNFTLLHGREAFEAKAPRYLRRVHVLSDPALSNPHLVFHQ